MLNTMIRCDPPSPLVHRASQLQRQERRARKFSIISIQFLNPNPNHNPNPNPNPNLNPNSQFQISILIPIQILTPISMFSNLKGRMCNPQFAKQIS